MFFYFKFERPYCDIFIKSMKKLILVKDHNILLLGRFNLNPIKDILTLTLLVQKTMNFWIPMTWNEIMPKLKSTLNFHVNQLSLLESVQRSS